jgi:hypothetical protein
MIRPAGVRDVRVSDALITFVLEDGREISAPTEWSYRTREAPQADRDTFVIESDGMVVEWPTLDEHIGVWTLLDVPEEEVFAATGLKVVQPAGR